jgi:DNA polymerase-3 subunit alpha
METPEIKFTPEQYQGPSGFAHLHAHSVYSTLDGVATPFQYAVECQKRGYPGMAITEHGHMGSFPDMHSEFKKLGLKAVPGCEIYWNDHEPMRKLLPKGGYKALKESADPEERGLHARMARNRHLTVLAKNTVGYHNLIKLTTQAHATGFFYKPRIWFDKLCEFKEGLIVLSGCLNGPVAYELRMGGGEVGQPRLQSKDERGAVDWVKKFKAVFGEDYYIETQMPRIEGDVDVFHRLLMLADHFKQKAVLANDSHYMKRQDFFLQKIMMAIDQGMSVDSPDLFHVNSDEQFFKTRGELWATYNNYQYATGFGNSVFESMCDTTLEIMDKCEPIKIDGSPKTPVFENDDGILADMVYKGLAAKGYDKIDKRFLIDGKEVTYKEQVEIEMARFIEKGFSSYFLITQDLIQYGSSRGWPFAPRGSAGGSLVCHVLGIHPLNPLPWGLSFDRFLSPSRGGYMLKVRMPAEAK